ncbi:MAG: BatD family protein [Sulfurimonas sp.]|nr:BatD family protein [Sulfurimonas sp.]
MKNLGKLLIFLILFPHVIYAGVKASVNATSVEVGEVVTFSITLSGDGIKRPRITTLCGEDVIATGSRTNIQMINNSVKKSQTLTYKFMPQKTCEIKPIEINIGGKTELTSKINIEVKEQIISPNSDFILIIEPSKKELYVGEEFEISLLFKQRLDVEVLDNDFTPPNMQGFWIKSETEPIRYKEDNYTITKLVYKVAPQREGALKIKKAKMRVATRSRIQDSWGSWIPNLKWRSYFSNEIDIQVKALPQNIKIVGDFSIEVSVDKLTLNANEAVNVNIKVVGKGNLEDIENFKPQILGVSVFEEDIKIKDTTLSQKMAFISDRDFTIPPFSIKYFDLKTKKIKTITTKAIDIDVIDEKKVEELVVKKDEEVAVLTSSNNKEISIITAIIIFLVGLLSGAGLMLLKPFKKSKKIQKLNTKDEKALLMKLLAYKDDKEVQEMIDIIERNLYSDEKVDLDKKVLKELIKSLECSL